MKNSDPNVTSVCPPTIRDPLCHPETVERPRPVGAWLRLLAAATAAAALLSGLNALVQISKVALEYGRQHGP